MTQTYPFSRGAPGSVDYVYGQRVNPVEINAIDKNAAQAADGLIWSDVAVVRNFVKGTAPDTYPTNKAAWDFTNKRWVFFGSNGGAPEAYFSHDGQADWIALGTPPLGTFWGATSAGACIGVIYVMGGTPPGAASASKIRESHDSGATWTARNTVASSTEGVTGVCWFSGPSLFVLGLDSATSTNVETSPDGQTWTQRTGLPNSVGRAALAASSSIAVAINSSGNKCIRSTNGTSWTEGVMPTSATWRDVTWWAQGALFVAIGDAAIATSADGISWSSSGMTAPFTTAAGIATFGRLLVAAGTTSSKNAIAVSDNSGLSWSRVKSLTGAPNSLATGDGQILCYASGDLYTSLRVGL